MTLKRSLARRPNRNSTMLGLKLKYRSLYNSLNYDHSHLNYFAVHVGLEYAIL